MELERSSRRKKKFDVEASSSRSSGARRTCAYKRFPNYSNIADQAFKSLLETCGLDQLYACLKWRWTPVDFIVDFVGHTQIQESTRFEDTIILYYPRGSGTPMLFTMHNVAATFKLDLQGFYVDKATCKDVDMNDRYRMQKTPMGDTYFPVTSAASNGLYLLAKFVMQVIFQSRNPLKGSIVCMRHLQVALDGKPVAWGKLLWKFLVKRLLSCQQQEGARDFHSKLKSSYVGLAAVIAAVLLRVEINSIPDHEEWYSNLLCSLPETENSSSDYFESLQSDEPKYSSTEEKDSSSCGQISGSREFVEHQEEEEEDSQVEILEVVSEDDEMSKVGRAFPANKTGGQGQRSAPVRGGDNAEGSDLNQWGMRRKRMRAMASMEVTNADLDGERSAWDEDEDDNSELSNVRRDVPGKRRKALFEGRVERMFQPTKKLKHDGIEDLPEQEMMEQITDAVYNLRENTQIEKHQKNHKRTEIMSFSRDVVESVSNANRILANTLELMEETVLQKSDRVNQKYEAARCLISQRSGTMTGEEDEECLGKDCQDDDREAAKKKYYENVATADLSHEIMNLKKDMKLMNLYLHVNAIKLDQREEKLLEDQIFDEIRQLLQLKLVALDKLVENIRDLNEDLKLQQEKVDNEMEMLDLKEDEIKTSRFQ
ncbi:hypothetical protein AXG93_1593s1650 [Marchantia polymorpha subsp. ruderalis]|uniref:Uncharacterized protein n=1 Tax=Marchantia polymorpha subsp. ruderalis TaxID=1480154 RepID=A0A176WPJ2_MARPO|nr:hypothetical protein AXG93_1593s1650 [Marchantia polymorpha subsp. ruderalis]